MCAYTDILKGPCAAVPGKPGKTYDIWHLCIENMDVLWAEPWSGKTACCVPHWQHRLPSRMLNLVFHQSPFISVSLSWGSHFFILSPCPQSSRRLSVPLLFCTRALIELLSRRRNGRNVPDKDLSAAVCSKASPAAFHPPRDGSIRPRDEVRVDK